MKCEVEWEIGCRKQGIVGVESREGVKMESGAWVLVIKGKGIQRRMGSRVIR